MVNEESKQVPVKRDARTFEQRRKDMFNRLRKGAKATNEVPMEIETRRMHSPCWFTDVNRWIDDMDRTWDYDMRQMRNDMFSLMPIHLFDVPAHDFFAPHGDIPSILNRMDRQLETMRHHMARTMGLNGQSHAGMLTGGLDTGVIVPRLHDRPLDYLKDAYEVSEDGHVHFKLRFDVRGYSPEDIQVTTSKHGLNVHAKKSSQTDTSSSVQEFSRTLYLPQSVDADHFECQMTEDGVLTLEAPVKDAEKPMLTFNREQKLSVKPTEAKPQQQIAPSGQELSLQPIGIVGPTVLKDEHSHGSKLHVEVPVEPGFGADDLCVRMDANRVIVSGKKEVHEDTESTKGFYLKEFSRSYEVPETVDTFSVKSQLHGNTLLVEAPLLTPTTSQ